MYTFIKLFIKTNLPVTLSKTQNQHVKSRVICNQSLKHLTTSKYQGTSIHLDKVSINRSSSPWYKLNRGFTPPETKHTDESAHVIPGGKTLTTVPPHLSFSSASPLAENLRQMSQWRMTCYTINVSYKDKDLNL